MLKARTMVERRGRYPLDWNILAVSLGPQGSEFILILEVAVHPSKALA